MSGSQTIGILTLSWLGQSLDTKKGGRLRLASMANRTQVAGRKVLRSQQFREGMARATVFIEAGASLSQFNPGDAGELQVQADTGQTWTMPSAYILDAPEMQDDGSAEITWNFGTQQELIGASS